MYYIEKQYISYHYNYNYITLYYILLHYIILYNIILDYIILYYTILYYVTLYRIVLYCIGLYWFLAQALPGVELFPAKTWDPISTTMDISLSAAPPGASFTSVASVIEVKDGIRCCAGVSPKQTVYVIGASHLVMMLCAQKLMTHVMLCRAALKPFCTSPKKNSTMSLFWILCRDEGLFNRLPALGHENGSHGRALTTCM